MFHNFLKHHALSEYEFRSSIFPTVENRAFWETFPNEDCIGLAKKEQDYSWPVIKATDFMEFKKSGDRIIMENIHFDRREHLVLFALAELKENKGQFLPQIVNGLLTTCEETFWGLSAHWPNMPHEYGNIHRADEPYIDLFAAETAEHLAVITALFPQTLTEYCPEILDRVEYELERRIKSPYLTHRDWNWMGYHSRPNNWLPWIVSNLMTVFLLTEKNERRLHRALEKMLTELQSYYDALPNDGGCDEGPCYWNHAGASLFECIYQLKLATNGKLDLFADKKLSLIAAYLKKVHTVKDHFVNVADAHETGHTSMMPLLYGFGRETGQADLMNLSAALYREYGTASESVSHTVKTMRRLIFYADFIREMETLPISDPLHGAIELLPDLELCVLRKGEWTLSAKGGFNNESHNHNDVGSITLYDGTTPILIDVGINTYTKFTFRKQTRYTVIPWTRSSNHNVPLINQAEQPHGKEFRTDSFHASKDGIRISFASAYPASAGIADLSRSLTARKDSITITDRFSFTESIRKQVTEVLMSTLPVRIENGAVLLGDRYRITAKNLTPSVEFLPFDDDRLESDWQTKGVFRITLSTKEAEEITVTVERIGCEERR